MNRKQIVNENLQWPEMDEKTSEKITDTLEAHFRKYPDLKRRKNPPKRCRKYRRPNDEFKKNPPISKESAWIKRHIRIGINVITKTLEREPTNVMFVLVCQSCRPLAVLTRHIQLMCSMNGIPAGCVHNLSTSLKPILNIDVRALLVRKTDQLDDQFKIEELLRDWSEGIPNLLPVLKNPFGKIETIPSESVFRLIDDIKRECRIDAEKNEGNRMETEEVDENSSEDEEEQEFGANYLRIRGDRDGRVKWLDFDNDQDEFIRFNDSYTAKRKK